MPVATSISLDQAKPDKMFPAAQGSPKEPVPPMSAAAKALRAGEYVHHSGRRYELLAVGRDEASLAEVVTYRGCEGGQVWVRTLASFAESVEQDGRLVSRFAYAGKLVRDFIPGIIAGRGEVSATAIAGAEEYRRRLAGKLVEEANEFLASGAAEELADVLEVVEAICDEKGIALAAVSSLQRRKREERGGFGQRAVLLT